MFEAKRQPISPAKSTFVQAALKKSAQTTSGNGAKKFDSSGDAFVDQFAVVGSYKSPRPFSEIAEDCEKLHAINVKYSIVFIFYLRMITRVVTLFNGVSTKISQKGAEMKHEGIMRMLWLGMKHPDLFWKNIGLFVSVGSWKDIITMLQYDIVYNGWDGRVLDWKKFGELLMSGLYNDNTTNLVRKYLPQIKANSKCTTIESQADNIIAKWICSLVFGPKDNAANYKKYRKLKTAGKAHEWQKLISQGKHDLIDFGKIHGRALSLLVRGKYLFNQNLSEKYAKWVAKPETKTVKYTGFVHELFDPFGINTAYWKRQLNDVSASKPLVTVPQHVQDTVNKQFAELVRKGGEAQATQLIVVRDTSGSMAAVASGTKSSCYDIGKALALYFSEFLKGAFSNAWIEFNNKAIMHTWKGNTPMEKWFNDGSGYYGGTNFQSVIDLFCDLCQRIPEHEFPTGILCISDSEFNPAQLDETNVKAAKRKLLHAGFSQKYVNNFVIVLWNLQSNFYGNNTGKKFETYGDVSNVFYFSGYSAATISLLTSKIKNARELFEAAMDQEILNMIEV